MPRSDDIALEADLKQDALDDIAYFRKQPDGEANYLLACHASVPEVLTPEMLYLIRDNFNRDIHGQILSIPWMAVSDLLLSNLCKKIGHETFELNPYVRQELYKSLERNPAFGRQRLFALSDFLIAYIRPLLRHPSPARQREAQRQRWVALSITHPDIALEEISADYQGHFEQRKSSGQNYIRRFLEKVPVRNTQIDILKNYVAGTTALSQGDTNRAKYFLDNLSPRLNFGSTVLEVPSTQPQGPAPGSKQPESIPQHERPTLVPNYSPLTELEFSPLTEAVRKIPFEHPLSLLDLVNCDRSEQVRYFRRWFRLSEEKNRAHFCWIVGESEQKPESLAERLIYEISIDLEDESSAIFYPRRAESERVRTNVLPFGYDLDASRNKFKRLFTEMLNIGITTTFEEFIAQGFDRLHFEYMFIPLRVSIYDAEDWNLLNTFMDWMASAFSILSANTPHLVFFFVFTFKNKEVEDKYSIEQINNLTRKFNNFTMLPPLTPVDKADLQDWLIDLTGNKNLNMINQIIELLSNNFTDEQMKKFEAFHHIDMEHIEHLQELIYKISNR